MRNRTKTPSRRHARHAAALLAPVTLLIASNALGNGRFPRALRLVQDPKDPAQMALGATYGLLTSHDSGATWSYVCEQSFSLRDSYVGDPLVSFTGGGRLLVGVQDRITASDDGACSFSSVLGGASGEGIADYTIARGNPERILAIHVQVSGGSIQNQVISSSDQGQTWSALGMIALSAAYTIDVAPSDPTRVYVSGLTADNLGQLAVSDDGGMNFTLRPIPGTSIDDIPYIAAVHPTDKDRVFVRTDSWTDRDIIDTANDALLTTDDAGQNWSERYRTGAKLLGFALAPDGSRVLLGYGDPIESGRLIDMTVTGLYQASTSDYLVSSIAPGSVTCLSWTAAGIYVCRQQAESHYEIGFAATPDGLADPQVVLHRSDVQGPLACCSSSANSVCAVAWDTAACATFDECDAGAPLPDAGACGGSSGTAGAAGSSGAGTSGAAGSVASGGAAGSSGAAPAPGKSGGGCELGRSAGGRSRSLWAFAALLSGLAALGARARRRRSR